MTGRPDALSTSPDHLVHVAFSIDTMQVGGTELNALATAERLDRNRFRISVITLRGEGPLGERYAAIGIPVVRFPIRNLYGPRTLRQAAALRRFFREEGVAIVHAHDMYSNVFSVLVARAARVPVVIASKRWWSAPWPYGALNRLGFRLADRVLANSEAVGRSLVDRDGLNADHVAVVHNFIGDELFTPPSQTQLGSWRRELDLADGDRVVGIVASLLPVKDHETLIGAVALVRQVHPRIRLVVVGDGPERARVEARVRELGLEPQVRFAGLRPRVPSMHGLFEISVLCSRAEGFPNSILEAMASGRPVVATDVGGVHDAVEHNLTGLLVPPGDVDALAAAITGLLDEPARAREMGGQGAAVARSRFSAPAVIDSLERLYVRLLREAGDNRLDAIGAAASTA